MEKTRRAICFIRMSPRQTEQMYQHFHLSLVAVGLCLCLVAFTTVSVAKESELRDPTQPPMALRPLTAKSSEGFKLTSIIVGRNRRFAVINGSFVSVGERIAGAKVVSIRRNRVTLLLAGQVLKLYLIGNDVKKR